MPALQHRCIPLFVKSKDQIADKIKEYLTFIKNRWDKYPKAVHIDNGTEFMNKRVKDYLRDQGIKLQTMAPYSPLQNGVAERFNHTLIEIACARLYKKQLPKCLWEHAVMHAAYLRNRAPTWALQGKTPHEAWTGVKPDISHLHEFGCAVWIMAKDNSVMVQ